MTTTIAPTQTRELLSAMVDGELNEAALAAVLLSCDPDEATLANWNAYHVIGDMLRSPEPIDPGADSVFLSRFKERLAQEEITQVISSCARLEPVEQVRNAAVVGSVPQSNRAANDCNFRWKLLAGMASLAAVSVIAWNAFGVFTATTAPQLAQAGSVQQVVVASPIGPMVRDARLEELLDAHKQLGGTSVLQEPSGFLRNATFATPQYVRP